MTESSSFRPPSFQGVLAPMLTPFGKDGLPDPDRFVVHANLLLEQGCTGLAPFGTTGEALSLGLSERMALLEALVQGGVNPALLMPGTGLCSIADTIALTRHAVGLGCGGVLMLPPFFYKSVDDEGLYRFYCEVIEQTGDARLQIYLYHIPPVAHVGISLQLIGRLVESHPHVVVGLKDSSGDFDNTKAVIEAFPDFTVFAGSEVFLLDTLRAGGAGSITATANVNARTIRHVFDNWQNENADDLQAGINKVRQAIQSYPMIPMLKGLIAERRKDTGWRKVRPPLVEISETDVAKLVSALGEQFQS